MAISETTVRGSVEPWLMARWKARAEFLLSVIELLFPSLTVQVLQGKMCQNSLPSGGRGSVRAKISGGRGRPPANILIPLERQLIALVTCCMRVCLVFLVSFSSNLWDIPFP